MVVTDSIKALVGDWWPYMSDMIQSEAWDNLYRFLKKAVQEKKEIYPKSGEVWKSLQVCSKDNVKCIVILQCPYATKRQDKVIASGIPVDCSNIAPYQQPSLLLWWEGIESQYGFHPDNDLSCSLEDMVRGGVLLLNSAGTVEAGKVDSHADIWRPVMKLFCETVINRYLNGVPIVLIGLQAQRLEGYLNLMLNPILKVEHMAAAAHQDRKWIHGGMFKWINEHIRQTNGEEYMIQWLKKKSEKCPF